MTYDHLPEAVDTERAPPPPQAFGILSEKEFVRPSFMVVVVVKQTSIRKRAIGCVDR